jgi:hypothetical protein
MLRRLIFSPAIAQANSSDRLRRVKLPRCSCDSHIKRLKYGRNSSSGYSYSSNASRVEHHRNDFMTNTDYDCPKCNSCETRSFPAMYQSGLSKGTVSLGLFESASVRQQTYLSQRFSPPKKIGTGVIATVFRGLWYVFCFIFFLACELMFKITNPIITVPLFLILPALLFDVALIGINFLFRESFAEKMKLWKSSFYCTRCQHTFFLK